MKALKTLLVYALLVTPFLVRAQSFAVKESRFAINGTSNVHDWSLQVEKLTCTGYLLLDQNGLTGVEGVLLKIPVKALKSTKGKIMDNKTWEAFKYDQHPAITFKLGASKPLANHMLEVSGALTMAGITRPVQLKVSYALLPNGEFRISGTKRIDMTEFQMDPPTALMGSIKVDEEVDAVFEMILSTNNNTL